MSDIEFQIERESSVQESNSIADDDDMDERIQQMKKVVGKNEIEYFPDHQQPQDLIDLHEKLHKVKPDNKALKKKRNSFIPVNYLRTTFIMHLNRLYESTKILNDSYELAKCISYFPYFELNHEQTFQQRIQSLVLQFSLVFKIKNLLSLKSTTALEPEQYMLYFAQLCRYYGIKCRIARAFDFGMVGLELKYRIKSVEKQTEPLDSARIQQEIFSLNQQFLVDCEQIENLDDYMYNSKTKKTENTKPKLRIVNKLPQKAKNKKTNNDIEQFNQFCWLELFNENIWVPFDLISDTEVSFDINIIKQKLHHSFTYFVLVADALEFKEDSLNFIFENRLFKNIYFTEVTEKYCLRYKTQRSFLLFHRWFNLLNYKHKLCYKGIVHILKNPQYVSADRTMPPISQFQNEKDFKYSPYYALASQLSQYQMIRPNIEPTGLKYKDQDVFLKTDVIILHSKDKWRCYLRCVPDTAIPIKEVISKFDKTKTTQLFAIWETNDLKVSLEENNGQLPQNQYGNYETFAYPPPKGTVLFEKIGIKTIFQKNNIPFVEAVGGFDSKASKMFAQKCGYLIFEEDLPRVQELYDEFKIQQQIRNKENKRKVLKQKWSELFKGILLKRDLQQKYQQNA